MKTFVGNVLSICDNGDAILELPIDLLVAMGWNVGDELDISIEDGDIILRKKNGEKDYASVE